MKKILFKSDSGKNRKINWKIAIVLCVFVLAGVYYFLQYGQSTAGNKIYFTFQMQGAQNTGTLGIQSKELNSQTLLKGILCINHASALSKVDLFMPDMGHGSSPPVLSKIKDIPSMLDADAKKKIDYGCFSISKMEMFMPGLWQVRVFYKTGKHGVFDVNVPN